MRIILSDVEMKLEISEIDNMKFIVDFNRVIIDINEYDNCKMKKVFVY